MRLYSVILGMFFYLILIVFVVKIVFVWVVVFVSIVRNYIVGKLDICLFLLCVRLYVWNVRRKIWFWIVCVCIVEIDVLFVLRLIRRLRSILNFFVLIYVGDVNEFLKFCMIWGFGCLVICIRGLWFFFIIFFMMVVFLFNIWFCRLFVCFLLFIEVVRFRCLMLVNWILEFWICLIFCLWFLGNC